MLLSMTGYGEARGMVGTAHVLAELRSVNNRHFKLTLRCPDGWQRFEPEIERCLRERVSRGTLTLHLHLDRGASEPARRINVPVLMAYWQQLDDACRERRIAAPSDITQLLGLPGVIDAGEAADADPSECGPQIERLVQAVAGHFQQFREREGAAMAAELTGHVQQIEGVVEQIAGLAPQVVTDYRDRLQVRVQEAVQATGISITAADLVREVAIFTDRADITEELARLRSHLAQFRDLLVAATSQGRKLEFLCQEMFRETNTMGSKANHVGVAHAAVEIKTIIERLREIVLNVE